MRFLAAIGLLAAAPSLAEDRVAQARKDQAAAVAEAFRAAGVSYPPRELYLRAFKAEKELEVWAGEPGKPLVKVKAFPFCYASGELGPKRRLGDLQVPEGFYRINHFNPRSNFHLSLGVSYPNESDRILGERGRPGGDIYIHGSCVSIGCIAIEDGPIEQLYLMALDARERSGKPVPVHIFPHRLDDAGMAELERAHGSSQPLLDFWKSLRPGYLLFEENRRPPLVTVDAKTGAYRIARGR
ncbi:MAG: L,D-transpeptidase family protein [Myxococcales bacterium]|nr:L,D-transpeptidase family protein [Myxococcales bacterium]